MTIETGYNQSARLALLKACPGARIYKHKDSATLGMPDTSITWADATSWLEFKRLTAKVPSVWQALKKNQLAELVRLERAGHRAWIVAYDTDRSLLGAKATLIFRPSYVLTGAPPVVGKAPVTMGAYGAEGEALLRALQHEGFAGFTGINHPALVWLIHQTHHVKWPRRIA